MDRIILIGGIGVEILLAMALILTVKAKNQLNNTNIRLQKMAQKIAAIK